MMSNIVIKDDIGVSDNNCEENKKPCKKRIVKSKPERLEITYDNYFKSGFDLNGYKIPEIKEFLKTNKLLISGTKPALIERVNTHFLRIKNTLNIQRIYRGYLVREIIKLRGPAFKNRSLCVNDTDFVSMDKINEIPDMNFFSYADDNNFIYGFDIVSLIQAYKAKNMENPYNREKLSVPIKRKIKSFYKKTCIFYPEIKIDKHEVAPTYNTRRHRNINSQVQNPISNRLSPESNDRYNLLLNMREKPIEQRMQDLFMEIDQLGNYTQVSWFSNLNVNQYIRLYRTMFEIWNYRSGLSHDAKLRICPFYGPFERIFQRNVYYDELSLTQIQAACTSVFETLVFSGIDDDHRRLGAFHALSSLTVVSTGARQAMPWLYESVAF
jgi:hypothetical protein